MNLEILPAPLAKAIVIGITLTLPPSLWWWFHRRRLL
jgi:hypothetical protein